MNALPVVCLIAACTGLIMALQGGAEMRRFGAMQFVINLVAVSMTRELGPLITAITVVGRSGSSFSAEIGTMVVTEEVDALRSMALDPVEFLLVPKYVAMLIMLPCLTIAASTAGILAGGIFVYFTLDMGLSLYLREVSEVLVLRDIVAGLIKSLAFGTIIVHVGCFEGFSVTGGPEGVGRATTSAVVKSIFLVVLADLMFTGFFLLLLEMNGNGQDTAASDGSLPPPEAVISVREVVVRFGERIVLNGVNLDIYRSETMVILGGSGSGKTTLLRRIIGLEKPTSGHIFIKGVDITTCSEQQLNEIRRIMGVSFQSAALFNSMTLAENVALPLREHTKLAEPTIQLMTRMKLEQVGLGETPKTSTPHSFPGACANGRRWRAL